MNLDDYKDYTVKRLRPQRLPANASATRWVYARDRGHFFWQRQQATIEAAELRYEEPENYLDYDGETHINAFLRYHLADGASDRGSGDHPSSAGK